MFSPEDGRKVRKCSEKVLRVGRYPEKLSLENTIKAQRDLILEVGSLEEIQERYSATKAQMLEIKSWLIIRPPSFLQLRAHLKRRMRKQLHLLSLT